MKPETFGIKEKDGYKYYVFKRLSEQDNSSEYTFTDEEEVRQKFYYPFLKQGIHVLDIGAGYGSYTLPALQAGCKVTVITPKVPAPNNEHLKLKMNIDLNNFDCEIIDMAVHGATGWFNPNTKDFVKHSKDRKGKKEKVNDDTANEVNDINDEYVRCQKLDDIIYGQVDFIKMDVEGAEYEAIKGAEQIIKKYKPTLLIENHLFHDKQMERKIILLIGGWKLGYEVRVQPYHAVSHSLFFQK